MKYLIIFVVSVLFSGICTAQKVKIKDNIATIDDETFLNVDRRNMGNEISIKHVNSENEEIFIAYISYKDPKQITKANPEGYVRWLDFYFPELSIRCEIENRTQKGLVKFIYENNLYIDGTLSPENCQKLVNKYGMRFTENRPNGNINIIINN